METYTTRVEWQSPPVAAHMCVARVWGGEDGGQCKRRASNNNKFCETHINNRPCGCINYQPPDGKFNWCPKDAEITHRRSTDAVHDQGRSRQPRGEAASLDDIVNRSSYRLATL